MALNIKYTKKMNKFRIEENWLIESLPVWDWSNGYKYSNWMAIVTRDEKGMEHRDYLIKSKNKDEFFNLSSVKEGDVLMAGCYDRRKSRGVKSLYYAVLKKSDDTIVMEECTTYRKAKKGLLGEKKDVIEKEEETEKV